jgi:hypothetical protein
MMGSELDLHSHEFQIKVFGDCEYVKHPKELDHIYLVLKG